MDLNPADLCEQALEAIVAKFGTTNLPERRYVHVGPEPVTDRISGDAFVVHGISLYEGDPGAEAPTPTLGYAIWSLQFGVTIARCTPEGAIDVSPDAYALDVLGKIALTDGARLVDAAVQARQDGTLLPNVGLVVFAPVVWDAPDGGMVTTTLPIHAGLS